MTRRRRFSAIYLCIAAGTLLLGVLVNLFIGSGSDDNIDPLLSFLLLLWLYFIWHLAAISIALLVSRVLDPRPRAVSFFAASATAVLLSIKWTVFGEDGVPFDEGIHLVVIYAVNLFFAASYYFWMVWVQSFDGR